MDLILRVGAMAFGVDGLVDAIDAAREGGTTIWEGTKVAASSVAVVGSAVGLARASRRAADNTVNGQSTTNSSTTTATKDPASSAAGLPQATKEANINTVNGHGSANSVTTRPPADPNTSQVEWFDRNLQKLGVTKVLDKRLTKLHPYIIFWTGDVVKANRDITCAGKTVCKQGDLGTLKERDGILWNIYWWESGREHQVHQDNLTKCDPAEYIIAGDIVKVNSDLALPNNKRVRKGTRGTVKRSRESDNVWLVSWEGIGESYVEKDAVTKLAPTDYKLVGDVVRATCDICSSKGEIVGKGTLGTLKAYRASDSAWLVQWKGSIGELYAVDDILKKCDPTEFWRHGDFLKTTEELTCGGVAIPIGSPCKFIA